MADKHKERKRRKTKGMCPLLLEQMANILLYLTRFAGDDTLGNYSGTLKELIIGLQLNLRTAIATDDAFPSPLSSRAPYEHYLRTGHKKHSKRGVSNVPLVRSQLWC